MSFYNKVRIIFMLFLINYSESFCKIEYIRNSKDEDAFNIISGKGPLLYVYNSQHEPEFRYPISDGSRFCLFYSSSDVKHPDSRLHLLCPNRGQSLHIDSYPNNALGKTFLTEYTSSGIHYDFYLDKLGPLNVNDINSLTCNNESSHPAMEFFRTETGRSSGYFTMNLFINALHALPVYRILYSIKNRGNLMSHVKIVSIINKRPIFTESVEYKQGNIYEHYDNYSKIYDREYQKKIFIDSQVDKNLVEKYFSDNNCLIMEQLVNKDDLFYHSQQISTYYYDNTIPVWDSISKGNWNIVNNIIRDLADETAVDLEVFTYPYGSLKINNHEICLFNTHIDIPHLLVKVVYLSTNVSQGVVFHVANDPYIKKEEMISKMWELCSSYRNCDNEHPELLDIKRGLTYCCDVENSKIYHELRDLH